MEASQQKNIDKNFESENAPIVTTEDEGKVLIQLEGSHTTSTETEHSKSMEKKNVNFDEGGQAVDEKEDKVDVKIIIDIFEEVERNLNEIKAIEALIPGRPKTDFCKFLPGKQPEQLQDSNLKQFQDLTKKSIKKENIELNDLNPAEVNSKSCVIYPSETICDFKNVACQTQIADEISINEYNVLEMTSLTSKSEQPNSLNNYAQAENACVSDYSLQPEIAKLPFANTLDSKPLTTAAIVEEPLRTTPFNIITIEANSIPSSTDLRRPPLCQRFWNIFCDFCAATLLCLQVNKDCILCLGFFAAFVVSASFLTAFFYHTLVMSPLLWETVEN